MVMVFKANGKWYWLIVYDKKSTLASAHMQQIEGWMVVFLGPMQRCLFWLPPTVSRGSTWTNGSGIHYTSINYILIQCIIAWCLHVLHRSHSLKRRVVEVCGSGRLERPRHAWGGEWGDDIDRVHHPLQLVVHCQGTSSNWVWCEDCPAGVLEHTEQ